MGQNRLRQKLAISIHALLAESDGGSGVGSWPRGIFLSTLSLRRATARRESRQQPAGISIHALLAESDPKARVLKRKAGPISIHALLAESDVAPVLAVGRAGYFYPRSPCGERHDTSALTKCQVKFLSTLSLRRATLSR